MEPLQVPVQPQPHWERREANVWSWSGNCLDCGDDAAEWFSKYLETPVRLVRFDPKVDKRPTVRSAMKALGLQHILGLTSGAMKSNAV